MRDFGISIYYVQCIYSPPGATFPDQYQHYTRTFQLQNGPNDIISPNDQEGEDELDETHPHCIFRTLQTHKLCQLTHTHT